MSATPPVRPTLVALPVQSSHRCVPLFALLLAATSVSAQSWVATGNLTKVNAGANATLLPNGKVLLVGGSGTSGPPYASAELYDPVTGTFTATGSMAGPRYGEYNNNIAALLSSGKVVVIGGFNGSQSLATAELYDPATGSFSVTGSMSAARLEHEIVRLANGRILVTGGIGNLASAEIYDPATGTFSATGSLATGRSNHRATLLPNGKVLVTGGFGVASAELYDPATGSFASTGSMASQRGYHKAVLLPNGKVLVAGGATGPSAGTPVATAEIYDPATGVFTLTGSMAATRTSNFVCHLLSTGKVLIAGGANGGGSGAELYDPATGTFSSTTSMSAARAGVASALLSDGSVLVAGGTPGGSVILSTAETYRPRGITIGTVADMNGDGATGDDVTGNIAALDFPGAATSVTAARVGTLLGTTSLSLATTNNISVSNAVTWNSTSSLTLNAGDALYLNASVANAGTGSATFISGAATTLNATSISTGGSQTYNGGGIMLATNATLSSTSGNIVVNGAINGAQSLVVTAPSKTFSGTIGATTALATFTANGGSTTFNGNVTTTGALTITDAITLNADTRFQTTNSNITVGAINSPAKNVTFSPGSGALSAATVTANVISMNGSGTATFNGALTANGVDLAKTGGAATFTGNVAAGTLTTASQNYSVNLIGATTQIINDATFANTGSITLGGGGTHTFAGGLDTTAASGTTLNGTLRTAGQQIDLGAVTISGASTIDSTNNGGSAAGSTINIGAITAATNAVILNAGAGNLALGNVSGGSITITNAGAVNLTGAINLTGGLVQTNAATGNSTLNAGVNAGSIDLKGTNLVLGGNLDTATGNVSLNYSGGVSQLSGTITAGSLTLGGSGNVGNVTAPLTISAPTLNFNKTGGSTFVGNSGAVSLAGSVTGGGNISIGATGAVTQGATSLAVGGTTTINATTINLSNSSNNFGGVVSLQTNRGGNITIADTNAIALGTVNATGFLTVNAGTHITQASSAAQVYGNATFTSTAGNISLTSAGNMFLGPASFHTTGANDVAIVSNAALGLESSSIGGNFSLTANGTISSSGLDAHNGTTTFSVTAPSSDILLGTPNNFGAVAPVFAGTLANIRDVSLRNNSSGATTPDFSGLSNLRNLTLTHDAAGISFGATTLHNGGNLTASAGGPILQSGVVNVPGATNLSAGANAIQLTNSANVFGGAVHLANSGANNVAINASGALTFGSVSLGTGDFAASAGAMTQFGAFTQAAGATSAQFNSGAAPITLTNAGNAFSGSLRLYNSGANDVSVINSGALTLGDSSVGSGNLTVNAVGITQGNRVTQAANAGAATFSSGASAITLNHPGNDFTGRVNLSTTGNNAASVTDTNAIKLGTMSLGTGALTVNANAGGTPDVAGISQATTDAISVGGATFIGGAGAISLTSNTNIVTGPVTFNNTGSTNNVAFTNNATSGTTLGNSSVGNNLTLTSLRGAVVQNAATTLSVPGRLVLAAPGNDVVLEENNTINAVTVSSANSVRLKSTSGFNFGNSTLANNLTLTSGGALTFGQGNSTIGGPLTVIASGGITQAGDGALAVTGASSFAGGANAITLTNPANHFAGPVSLMNVGSNVTITDAGALKIGTVSSGGALTATGSSIELTANVTATGGQFYNAPTTLSASTMLTAGNSAVLFNSTLSSANATARDLIVNAGSGNITLSAAAGGTNALGAVALNSIGNTTLGGTFTATSLATNPGGNTVLSGGAVTTSGAQTYNDAVELGAGAVLATSNSDVTLGSTLNSANGTPRNLTVSAGSGNITLTGVVGGGNALDVVTLNSTGTTTLNRAATAASLTTNAGGMTALNGGGVTTIGTQNYNDNITLGQPTTLTGSAVTFNGTVAGGNNDLAVIGNAIFGDAAGDNVTGVGSLTVSGTTSINTSAVTTSNRQTYNGAVNLGIATTLTAPGTVLFGSTLDSAATVADITVISTGGGNITLTGAAGATNSLGAVTLNTTGNTTIGGALTATSVRTNAGGNTVLSGGAVTTTGAQTYNDAVTLGAGAVLTTNNDNVTLGSTVDSASSTPQNLTVSAGSGNITMMGAVGVTRALGAVTLNSTGATTVGGTFAAASLTTNAGGTIALNGGSVTTTGAQTYNDNITLGATTTLAGASVHLLANVTGGNHSLTINSTGNATLFSATGLASLAKTGNGTLTLSGQSSVTGNTTVGGGVLKFGIDNALPASTAVLLAGGALSAAGSTQSLGLLAISASSTLDFGGGALLSFANSSATSWNGLLTVTNYSLSSSSLHFGNNASGLTAAQLGSFRFADFGNGTAFIDASGTVAPITRALVGGSVLANVSTAQGAIVGAFTVEGIAAKQMLVRALGPALAALSQTGLLADPQLEIVNATTGAVVASNDDWSTAANAAQIVAATAQVGGIPLASGSKDAAVLTALAPGTYRVRVTGASAASGRAMVEVYDTDAAPRLVSVTTRAPLGAGATAAVQGFTVTGSLNRSYLIRALGPALGLAGAATDPQLAVFSGSTRIAGNDNWNADAVMTAAVAATGAMSLGVGSKDAALVITLPPGAYTIQVSDAAGGTALLEILEADLGRAAEFSAGIVSPPENTAANVGRPAVLGVVTVGKPAPSYQWRKNGSVIPGATNPRLVFDLVQPADHASYDVIVANAGGTVTSAAAALATLYSGDTNRDSQLSLLELTRVIELYNTRNNLLRTGAYLVDPAGEDGFNADLTRAPGVTAALAAYHSADSDRDGRVSLFELTRVIELYNTLTGTTRTGRYHVQPGTEDGFAPGP